MVKSVEQRHLRKGDAEPPLTPGQLRLYTNRFCPFAQRAVLVLKKKKISYDEVNIHLQDKPEWYVNKNPAQKVPTLELSDGRTLDESLIVAEYLNEAFPGVALYPQDAYAKAIDKLFIEKFGTLVFKALGPMMHDLAGINNDKFEELLKSLEATENELASRGTPFLGGSQPGMVDLMIWPIFERVAVVEAAKPDICKFPAARFPKLLQWKKNMVEDPEVSETYLPGDVHLAVMPTEKDGERNFDLLVKN